MNKIYIIIAYLMLIFIFSCDEEKEENFKNNEKVEIEKIEVLCYFQDKNFFKIISKEGYTDKDKNLVYLKDVKGYLFKDNKLYYELNSNNGKYIKDLNQIIIYSASGIDYKNKFKFSSDEVIFKQKEKNIIFKNIFISFLKNEIQGKELILDENFNELKIKGVKTNFH